MTSSITIVGNAVEGLPRAFRGCPEHRDAGGLRLYAPLAGAVPLSFRYPLVDFCGDCPGRAPDHAGDGEFSRDQCCLIEPRKGVAF